MVETDFTLKQTDLRVLSLSFMLLFKEKFPGSDNETLRKYNKIISLSLDASSMGA